MLALVLKAVATAVVVAVAGRLAARGGPRVAALAVGLPLNAGPGFLLVIGEGHDAAFVSRSALVPVAGCGAVLVFAACYIRVVPRLGLGRGLAVASAGWAVLALPVAVLPATLPAALALTATGALVARLLWRHDPRADPTGAPAPATWAFLVGRGLLLGGTVATVARLASTIGPVAAGLAFTFPLTITSSALVLDLAYGRAMSVAAVARVPQTLWAFASFAVVLWALAGPVGSLAAWSLGIAAAIAVTGLTGWAMLRERVPAGR